VAFGFFGLFLASVATSYVAYLLKPKPQIPEARKPNVDNADVPPTQYGTVIPRVYGTAKVKGLIIWVDKLQTIPIYSRQTVGSTWWGKKKKEDVLSGYQYKLSFAVAFHAGEPYYDNVIDAGIKALYYGGQEVWSGNAAGGSTYVTIKNRGKINIHGGVSPQATDPLIDAKTPLTPGYSGIVYATFEDWDLGDAPQLKPIEMLIKNEIENFDMIGDDVNPAGIVYDMLTDVTYQLSLDSSLVDLANFQAVATVLETEGLGMTITMRSQRTAQQWIEEILRHIDGMLQFNKSTGKFQIKLLRDDYDEGLLTVFTESEIKDFQLERKSWSEITNDLTVSYTNRSANYIKSSLSTVNQAAQAMAGRVNRENYDFMGITTFANAQKVLQRLVNKESRPLAFIKMAVPFALGKDFKQGDVFKIQYSLYDISSFIVRVLSATSGENDDNTIELEVVEDVFATPYTGDFIEQDNEYVPTDYTITKIDEWKIFDSPVQIDSTGRSVVILPVKNSEFSFAAKAYMSEDGGTTYTEISSLSYPYCGRLNGVYPIDTYEVDRFVGFRVDNIYGLDFLSSLTEDEFQERNYSSILNNEFISFKNIDLVSGDTYSIIGITRGEYDTNAQAHVNGELLFLLNMPNPFTICPISDTLNSFKLKIVPRTPFREISDDDIDDADVIDYVYTERNRTLINPTFLKAERVGNVNSLVWEQIAWEAGADYFPVDSRPASNIIQNGFFELVINGANAINLTDSFYEETTSITTTYQVRTNMQGFYTDYASVTLTI